MTESPSVGHLLLVCLGGAAGSGARYLLATWVGRLGAFPVGTWLVNVFGCFALSLVLSFGTGTLSPGLRVLLTTGFMGGFTTYSTFNGEVIALWRSGSPLAAAAYLAATLIFCVAAGLLGAILGRMLTGATS